MKSSSVFKIGVAGGIVAYLLCRLKLRHHIPRRSILGAHYCMLCGQVLDEESFISINRAIYNRADKSLERMDR